MRAFAVFYILGWLLAISAAAMLIPAAFALVLDPIAVVEAFLFPALVIGFIGVNMLIAFRGQESLGGRRQSVFLLAAVWIVVPFAGAMPLYAAGFPEEFVPAFFEAVSGFTTTGATVVTDLASVPSAIIVWRSVLQWMGGLATLLILATVLGPLVGGDLLDRQFRLVARGDQRTTRQLAETGQTIFLIYGSLTLLCFLSMLLSCLPTFDAFCLSLATVSTGGFMPREGTIALYGSSMAELVLAVFMMLGAVSVVWIQAVIFGRWTLVREMREPWIIGILVAGLGLVLAFMLFQANPIAGFGSVVDSVTLGLATAASLVSTSGFSVSDQAHSYVPYMVVLAICIIGAGGFSTAGGIKVHRVWAMFRQLGRELRLLVYPHGVRPSIYGGESREFDLMTAIWTTFAAFIMSIGALAVLLAATGVPFAGAFLASASAIGNMGPAYELTRIADFPDAPSFAEMTTLSQLALCGGMILGRTEVVVLLSLLSIAYWRD